MAGDFLLRAGTGSMGFRAAVPRGRAWQADDGCGAPSLAQLGAGLCRILQDTPCAKRQCTPQSASPPAPLAGEPLGRLPPHKASPARGGGCAAGADGGVRRLAPQISFRVAGDGRPPHAPAPGADDFRLPVRFALAQGPRDDASIVPYAARIKALLDFAGHSLRKAAMHPSVGFTASSPCRGAFGRRPPPKCSKNPPPAGACLAGGGAVYAFGYGAFFPHGQALTGRP